jgi:DNA-binding HxlR family transcriptional regulator
MAREEDAMSSAYPTQQGCPVARSLELIGDRWTLLVVRDLLQSLEGISPNLLSSRLKRLERAGIVQRRFYTQHPPRAEYLLTEKGRALSPVVRSIYEWGEQHSPRRARAR